MQIASLTSRHSTSWRADSCSSAVLFFSHSSSLTHALPPIWATQSHIPKTFGGCHVSLTSNKLRLPPAAVALSVILSLSLCLCLCFFHLVSQNVLLSYLGLYHGGVQLWLPAPSSTPPSDRAVFHSLQYTALIPYSQYDAIYCHLFLDDPYSKITEGPDHREEQWLYCTWSYSLIATAVITILCVTQRHSVCYTGEGSHWWWKASILHVFSSPLVYRISHAHYVKIHHQA